MVEKILPFLDKAPVISIKKQYLKTDKLSLRRFLPVLSSESEEIISDNIRNKWFKVWHIMPLDIYIADGNPVEVARAQRDPEILAEIYKVDYQLLADAITIEEDNLNKIASYPISNGFITQIIETDRYINAASNGLAIPRDTISNVSVSESAIQKYTRFLNEDLRSKVLSLKRSEVKNIDNTTVDSPMNVRLESYLKGGYVTQRIPLLIGGTAVAKSSSVKALCDKHGFRLVDLRTAFMSRLDLEGLTEVITDENGKAFSYNASMFEMIQCTDSYINYCRDSLPKIEKAIHSAKDPEKIVRLQKLYENYKEMSKPPVLFLDEITRTEASVRQALTKILTDKKFMGHEMKIARIISATNFPLGMPEDLRDLYLTADVDDAAFLDRFETIPVYPEDVNNSWWVWASEEKNGRQNIHKHVLSYLKDNNGDIYNQEKVIGEYMKDFDVDAVAVSAFPNYRTWELLSNYLYEKETSKKVLEKNIEGLIGSDTAKKVMTHLTKNGWSRLPCPKEDELDIIVKESLISNVPTMLIGPSGLGKTARVESIGKMDLGYKILNINLSEQDRTDLMGPPAKVVTEDFIGGKVDEIDPNLGAELRELVKKSNLPGKMTVKAPKASIANEFRKSIEDGTPVILFFDECKINGCTPSVA